MAAPVTAIFDFGALAPSTTSKPAKNNEKKVTLRTGALPQ